MPSRELSLKLPVYRIDSPETLPGMVERRPLAELKQVRSRKAAELRRRNARHRIRDEERQRRFDEAVERDVAERLAALAVHS